MDAGKQIPRAVDLSNGYNWVFEILVSLSRGSPQPKKHIWQVV